MSRQTRLGSSISFSSLLKFKLDILLHAASHPGIIMHFWRLDMVALDEADDLPPPAPVVLCPDIGPRAAFQDIMDGVNRPGKAQVGKQNW